MKPKLIVFLSIVGLYALYSIYFSLSNTVHPVYEDCGIIVSKSTDEVAIKRGVSTELYLNINFHKSGFRSIEVGPTTYFKYKVGQSVCFDLDKSVSTTYKILMLSGLVSICILALIAVIAFFFYIVD